MVHYTAGSSGHATEPELKIWMPALPEDGVICALDKLEDGLCREFLFQAGEETHEGFLVCSEGQVHAYRNTCPHTGAPLNWRPEQFLTETGDYLRCALHGALFRIEDGECIAGPCRGQRLDKLPVRWKAGRVLLGKQSGG